MEASFALLLTGPSFVNTVAVNVHGVKAAAQAGRKGRSGFTVRASGADRLFGGPGGTERPRAALYARRLAFFVLIVASIARDAQGLTHGGLARSFWAWSRRGHGARWAVVASWAFHTSGLAFLGLEAS